MVAGDPYINNYLKKVESAWTTQSAERETLKTKVGHEKNSKRDKVEGVVLREEPSHRFGDIGSCSIGV